ncbi:MAG: response regulator [Acidobacteria bacterium]|nr:response regulator [Acidobacteriota bacterium]
MNDAGRSGTPTLVVEDDEPFRGRLVRALRDRGMDVIEAGTLDGAREALVTCQPSSILLDLRLGNVWTLDFIDELRTRSPEVVVVVLTGYGSIATAVEAVRRGARSYLTKPVEIADVVAALGGGGTDTGLDDDAGTGVKPMSLARLEWEHINRVLTECDGNVSEAARVLGLHRRSLQRKLAKFPMPR